MRIRALVATLLAAAVVTAVASAADPVPAPAPLDPAVEVARVGMTSVSRASFERWLRISYQRNGLKGSPPCPAPVPGSAADKRLHDQALTFLIRTTWLDGEAAERSIRAPRSEVRRSVLHAAHLAFPKKGEFARFLLQTCSTQADLELRQRSTILQRRITADVLRHKISLTYFGQDYNDRWRARTICAPGFVIADCSNQT